jgi:hypothetical protein
LERLLVGPYQKFVSENALIALYEIRRIRQQGFVRVQEDHSVELPKNTCLTHAELSGIRLAGAILDRADFSHADLTDANLARCRLTSVDFSHARLDRCDFTGAELDDVKFDPAPPHGVIGLHTGTTASPAGDAGEGGETAGTTIECPDPVRRFYEFLSITTDFSLQDILDSLGFLVQEVFRDVAGWQEFRRFRCPNAQAEAEFHAAYMNIFNY